MAVVDAAKRGPSGTLDDVSEPAAPDTRLTDEAWRRRHRWIVALAWLHAAGLPAYAILRDKRPIEAAAIGAPVAVLALAATLPQMSRRLRAAASTAALLVSSGLLLYVSDGLPEMHFHFFVVVTIVALYQDWAPFLVCLFFVAAEPGVVGWLLPESIFNHPWEQALPWTWAAVRALYVAGTNAVSLTTRRMNQRILMRQRAAEEDLREEKHVVETLHSIGTGVVAELDLGRVAQLVTDAAVKAVGASFGAFFYNVTDKGGERYLLYSLSGAPRSAFESFPMPRNTQIFEPTFSGSAVVRSDDITEDKRFGHNEPYHGFPEGHLRVRSYLAVPVRSRGSSEVLGGLFFGHPDAGEFGEREERLAIGIATQAAVAFDNARLYQAERHAHEMAEASQERLALLAETGRLISSSLDQNVALREIARLTVPTLSDACLVDVLEDDGRIVRIAAGAPGLERFAQGLVPFPPGYEDESHPIIHVMRTGEPTFVREIDEAFLDSITRLPQHRKIAEDLDPRSTIIVPLKGRERVHGSIAFINVASSGRLFATDDFALAEEIGRRAGMAVENARLYNQQRTVAESLQHALLPEQLPEITGFETTARYRPGSPGERVGGDWYDLFQIPSGEIAIAMGDVVGHGIPAASLMAQLRNSLRAYAYDGLGPSDVLSRLNHLLYGLEPEGMATIALAILDPISTKLRLSNAGHLPMLHVRGTETSFVGEGLGPPLGAIPFARYGLAEIELRPNDTAVFYTDGLVEDRARSLDIGLDQLRTAVLKGRGTIDELSDAVLEACIGDRSVDDDVALLIIRSIPLGSHLSLRLPSEPRILSSLRQTLRRWMREHDLAEDDVRDVLIACGEACNNAIEHGSASFRGTFEVEAAIDGDLRVVVRNEGGWREVRDDGGGRGLPLMEALMDEVQIDRGDDRIEVRMRRRLDSTP